jgi:hypothetical protein
LLEIGAGAGDIVANGSEGSTEIKVKALSRVDDRSGSLSNSDVDSSVKMTTERAGSMLKTSSMTSRLQTAAVVLFDLPIFEASFTRTTGSTSY